MKLYKQIIFILIVFFKTETVFSNNNLFNVNNIEIEKKGNVTNASLADKAIKKGFDQLIQKILLKKDQDKLSDLSFDSIKQLLTYYQIKKIYDDEKKKELINFSITFDRDKIHRLFYERGISYSSVSGKEIYVLPVLIKANKIFIFNNNFFYDSWNEFYKESLIEFVLPLEKIEIIKNVNDYKNNLIDLELNYIFEEYRSQNLALILIEDNINNTKIFIKTKIQEKNVSKSLTIQKENLNTNEFHEKIIVETKKELINLVKSKNLIDIRAPSFLNVKLNLEKKSNLVDLNTIIKNIESIENIYVQDFNKDYVNLRIKYLGKLEKIINELKIKDINLELINEEWIIRKL